MSELVENVARAVRPHLYAEGGNSEVVARAAIAAVAEWLAQSEDRECNPLQCLSAALRAAAGSAPATPEVK